MKKLSVLLPGLMIVLRGFSQSAGVTDTMRMTMEQCVAYALQNENSVKNAMLDAEISHRKTQEYTGIALPQISGTVEFTDFLKLPTSLIPAEFFGGEPGTFEAIQFGTQYNINAGATASQLVFDGRYFLGLKAARALSELDKKNVQRTKTDIKESVMKAYLAALITTKREDQLNTSIASFKKTYDDTKAFYKNGFVEKVDVDRLAVQYNNLLAEKEKIDKLNSLGIYMLKFQMGMDVNQPVILSDSLREADFQSLLQNAGTPDIKNRIEYQMLQTSQVLAEMNIKQYQLGYVPTLYAIGSLSYSAQRNEFDFFQGGDWFNTTFVGLTLNVPIFDGMQKARQVQQGKLSLQKTQNDIANFQNAMNLQIVSAKTSMQNAIASLNVQRSNVELAEEIVKISRKKFELGVGASLEVTDAEASFKDAQTNYLNALYDAWVAKIELDKALGILIQ